MSSNEKTVNTKIPAGLRLFNFLSKIDAQAIATVIMVLLSLQPLYGIFGKTASQSDLIALYYGKTVIIRFLGFLGIAVWTVDFYCRCFIHRDRAWKQTFIKRPWTGLLAILLAWSLFAVLAAADKHLAVFGGPYRYEGFISYLAYGGIFLNAALIKGEKQRKIIFATVTATSTFLALLTILRELCKATFLMNRNGQVVAYSATFVNSNHYGYYLCVSMMVIAGLFMASEKLWAKIVCGACFAINTVVMLYNASLGPYLAVALGLIVFFVFSLIRKGLKKTLLLLILIALFILLSFVINGHRVLNDIGLVAKQTGNVIDIIGSGGADTQEGQQAIDSIGSRRGVLWKNTIKIILEHPAIGVGTDNIQLYISNNIPHNEYLQIAANLGFPGIILYLAALISCFAFAIKNLKKLSDGALIAGMATLVYCASAFVGISIPIATYQLFFFLGMLTGWFKHRDDEKMSAEIMSRMKNGEASGERGGQEPKTKPEQATKKAEDKRRAG